MDHVAIMNKSWKLLPKILDGRKTVESRWSKFKIAPYGKIKVGDKVFFKNSGESVTVLSEVEKVLQFEKPTSEKIKEIIKKYGGEGKICFSNEENAYNWAKEKKYCTLIFLKNSKRIKPFAIDKKGYGNACAWMCVGDIDRVKK